VGGITFDGAEARLRAAGGVLHVDTASVNWLDGGLAAHGALGLTPADTGTLVVDTWAANLVPFDSLLRAATHLPPDTVAPHPFDGLARAVVTLHGALPAPQVSAVLDAEDVIFDRWRMGILHAELAADSLGATAVTMHASVDTLMLGSRTADRVRLDVAGRRDSLAYQGAASFRDLGVASAGAWRSSDSTDFLRLDTLALDFPRQHWRLTRPTELALGADRTVLRDTVELQTVDGGGIISLAGSVPGAGPGSLDVSVAGLDLVDAYGLLQHDTTSLAGLLSLDARLGGTREEPTLRGSGAVTGVVTADVRAPLIHAAFDYEDRRLRSRLTIWKTGDPILEVDVSLPYDLALTSRAERKLPGALSFSAVADSVDLLMLEALTPSLRNTTGTLHANIQGGGTWAAPRLDGTMALRDGAMFIPGLNVRYGDIQGAARFSGDSMIVDSLRLRSGPGTLRVSGNVEFPQLTAPALDLHLGADHFLAMNVPSYLTLQTTGDVTLSGPLWQPELRGRGTVTNSVLFFADLVTKDVLDLEDPAIADLVDQAALRRQGLGAEFQNRFLDSLRIRNLSFQLGSDVWLRSDEANIQLEGSVTVNKTRRRYLLDGTFTTPRGDYTLKVGPIRRDFTVESGTVTYQGTPDLNALLDIRATHTIRTITGDEIPVVASINGSLLVPKLTLASPSRNYGEFELMSYLLFGTPPDQVTSQGGREVLQLASATLSSEVSRTLVRSGLPLDLLQLRASPDGSSLTQLVAGRQLASKWFLTFNVGFCFGAQSQGFSAKNLGASIEYRINRAFRLQASAEPVQSCLTNRTSDFFTTLNRYQLGGDLLWHRDY
jgi:autotransporter translocation and assembly factor TamB